MLLMNYKRSFLAYSRPVMLTSRKVTKDKRTVTDFRHFDVGIAKNNLAHPLPNDTLVHLDSTRQDVS